MQEEIENLCFVVVLQRNITFDIKAVSAQAVYNWVSTTVLMAARDVAFVPVSVCTCTTSY